MAHTVLGTFESSSSSALYEVKIDNATGKLWCDCRGWKMKRPNTPYQCKHTESTQRTLEARGWRFERRWDEHTYVTARADGGRAATPQPQPVRKAATVGTPAVTNAAPPSLEQVRQANKKPGYEIVTRRRRNMEIE